MDKSTAVSGSGQIYASRVVVVWCCRSIRHCTCEAAMACSTYTVHSAAVLTRCLWFQPTGQQEVPARCE